jgi:hypothetical protein
MTALRKSTRSTIVHQPAAQFYERLVEGIKQRIQTAQIQAALSYFELVSSHAEYFASLNSPAAKASV